MTIKITKKTFSGSSNLFNGFLADALMGLARTQVAILLSSVSDLTDSTGGVAAATIVKPAALTTFTAGTTDAVAKAEFELTMVAHRTNLRQLIATVNAIIAKVNVFPALTDSLGGSAPGGSLIAIDDSMTGTSSGGALLAFAGATTTINAALDRSVQLAFWVNKLCVAFDVAPLTIDATFTTVSESATFAALSTDSGTAASTTGAVSKAQADVLLDVLADNPASLAAKLNALTGTVAVATVVAG